MTDNHGTKRTEQQVLNGAVDDNFEPAPLMVEPLGYDGTNLVKMKVSSDGETEISKLNMAVSGYSADITTTAQEIAFSDGDITIPENTKGIIIQNDDADNIIYLGGSTVTSAGANAAYALNNQGDSMSFNNIGTSFSVYVIGSAAGTQLRITYM